LTETCGTARQLTGKDGENPGSTFSCGSPHDPSQTKNAAPTAIGNGAKSSIETTQSLRPVYDGGRSAATLMEPEDAEVMEVELADGRTLCIACSPAGLMEAYDFNLASGAVLRFEKRIFQTIPGLSLIDERVPEWWETDADAVRSCKAMMVAYWNGMQEADRVSFLSKIVAPETLRRAAE